MTRSMSIYRKLLELEINQIFKNLRSRNLDRRMNSYWINTKEVCLVLIDFCLLFFFSAMFLINQTLNNVKKKKIEFNQNQIEILESSRSNQFIVWLDEYSLKNGQGEQKKMMKINWNLKVKFQTIKFLIEQQKMIGIFLKRYRIEIISRSISRKKVWERKREDDWIRFWSD